jgi:hypothetical protein
VWCNIRVFFIFPTQLRFFFCMVFTIRVFFFHLTEFRFVGMYCIKEWAQTT